VEDLQLAGGLADEQLAFEVDADDGGRQRFAEGVGDEARAVVGHEGDDGVRGAEVDADDPVHECPRRCRSGEEGCIISGAAAFRHNDSGAPRTFIPGTLPAE